MRTTCRQSPDRRLDQRSAGDRNSSNYEWQRLANHPFPRLRKNMDCHRNVQYDPKMLDNLLHLEHYQGKLGQRDGCRWLLHRYCYCCICVRMPRKGQLPQKQRQQEQPEQLKPSSSVASFTT